MKICKFLVWFVGIFFWFSFSAGAAYALTYCLEWATSSNSLGGYDIKCSKAASSPGEFLRQVPLKHTSSLPPNYNVQNGFISFDTGHFTYVIPESFITILIQDSGYNDVITLSDYGGAFDQSKNVIPDFFDTNYVDKFDKIYAKYFDDSIAAGFGFSEKKAWENNLKIYFDWIDRGGYFTSNPEEKIVMNITYKYKEDYLEAVIAHELFHAVEYGYIGNEMWDKGDNFFEGMAVMMESKVAIWSDYYLDTLDDSPLVYPELSIFRITENGVNASYGSFLWYTFLEEEFGKPIVKDLLIEFFKIAKDKTSSYRSFLACDNALKLHGSNITDAYLEYVVWNYDKSKYNKGDYFRDVYITKSHSSYVKDTVISDGAPGFFGSNYIELLLKESSKNILVDFTANSDADMYVSFLPVDEQHIQSNNIYDKNVVNNFIPHGQTKTLVVPNNGDYKKVIMAVSVIALEDIGSYENIFLDYFYPYAYSVKGSSSLPIEEVDSSDKNIIENVDGSGVDVNTFADLDDSHKNVIAILYLKTNGIIDGYPDGTFRPDGEINRGELMKILVEGMGTDPDPSTYNNCFSDVVDEWYAPYVCYAKEQNWVDGYSNGAFKPEQSVKKIETIKMLLNSQEVDIPDSIDGEPFMDVAKSDWYARYIYAAKEKGILEETGDYFEVGADSTRGGICENLYRLLTK